MTAAVEDDAVQDELDQMFEVLISMIHSVHHLPECLETRAAIAMHMASYAMAYAVSSVMEGGYHGTKETAASFVAGEITGMVLSGVH